ncbi:MAG TPA: TonB-dependent receptor plug domain-containing protein, partial [Kiritimatiellia bacterium]|nr:TonB-dependent receptor plug domain-containing protein [Kiritimatiellia bacterium]
MNTFRSRIAAAGAAVLAASAPCALSESSRFDLGEITPAGPTPQVLLGAADRTDGGAAELRGAADLANAAALLPGVSPDRDGDFNAKTIRVRGFGLNQAPLFLDGLPAGPPPGGRADLGRLGLLDMADISVARGFSPLAYGPNTLAGAVNAVSRKPARSRELLLRGGAFSGEGL